MLHRISRPQAATVSMETDYLVDRDLSRGVHLDRALSRGVYLDRDLCKMC